MNTGAKLCRAVAISAAIAALVWSAGHRGWLDARVFAQAAASSSMPGCAPDRPTVAHYPGGVKAGAKAGKKTLIPCTTNTGWRTTELGMVVTKAGTLVLQPAF